MTIADWLMILAVFLGPIVAVYITRYLDDSKEVRGRKLHIFKRLMATRGHRTSPAHVEALNLIDLVFYKDRPVIKAWKAFLDLLNDDTTRPDLLNIKRDEQLVDLLYEMAQVLNYEFDRPHIKNSLYSPNAHGELEKQQQALSRELLEVLDGQRPIPIYVYNHTPAQNDS